MIYDANDPRQYLALLEMVNKAKNSGKKIEAHVVGEKRSNQQNKYYHFVLSYYASQIGFTRTDAEREFKEDVNSVIFVREIDVNGKTHKVIRSSSDISKEEMTSAINNFISYAQIYAGINIPYEHEKNAIFECSQEIDKVKSYI